MIASGKIVSRNIKLMGNQFGFSIIADDEEWAHDRISEAVAEVQRIEDVFTTYNDSSQVSLINAAAGITPVKVDEEVFQLIERSNRISYLTQGAFDISYGSIDKRFWNFDTEMTALPSKEVVKETVRLVNFRNVILNKDESTVFLKEKGMRIGFGGIGKGYAADRAKMVLQRAGVESGIVNAAGDLTVWGQQPDGSEWTIGVADPAQKHNTIASIKLTDISVATSGSYEKFVVIDGKRYAHTIDPKTGYPVEGIKSVTILCKSAEVADAMATPVMVMGIKAGLHLINQVKDIACIIIDDQDKMYTSKNISLI